MAASVTHAFVSAIADDGDSKVGPSEWNDPHTLTDVNEVLYRNAAVVSAANNVEANLISTTIPANKLGTTRGIRFTCFGLFENSTGANQQYTMRVKFGSATSVIADASGNIATATGKRSFMYSGVLHNCASASVQRGFATVQLGANTSVSTTVGAGALSANVLRYSEGSIVAAGLAFDTTADQSFTVTLQLGVTNANLTYLGYYSVVELL